MKNSQPSNVSKQLDRVEVVESDVVLSLVVLAVLVVIAVFLPSDLLVFIVEVVVRKDTLLLDSGVGYVDVGDVVSDSLVEGLLLSLVATIATYLSKY